MYITLIPVLVIEHDNINEVTVYIQLSEFLSAVFLVNLFFKLKFLKQEKLGSFLNACELMSNLGVIIMSNLLFLMPDDFREDRSLGS